ncbi:MAG: helix-turn-helix domain-containing protein [Candidatus Coproplasma sp.]
MVKFADRLKELRKARGYSQKELAEKLNVTNSSVCDWERQRSEPSLATVIKIARLFDCSCDYLLGLTDY